MVDFIGTQGNNNQGGGQETSMYGLGGDDYLYSNKPGFLYIEGGGDNDYINQSLSISGQFGWFYGGNGNDIITGTIGNDYIEGGFDNDVLLGGTPLNISGGILQPFTYVSGDDAIYGGQGDDAIYGFDGNDTLYGGDGNDGAGITVTAGALALGAIYTGTALAGLYGGLGNDYIDGGKGNDSLYGFDGEDYIIGGLGDDLIYGEFGNDTIIADSGFDTVYGGDGNDNIYGGRYSNSTDYMIASGGNGNDSIYGGDNIDVLYGDNAAGTEIGTDFIWAGGGNDYLIGGNGTDVLIGNAGSDYFYGGAATDYFDLALGDVKAGDVDLILDFQAGTDYILMNAYNANDVIFGLSGTTAYGYIQGPGSTYYLFEATNTTAAQLQAATLFIV